MSTLFSQGRISIAGFWRRQNVSARLCVTGILSLVLLISDSRGWVLDSACVLNALHISVSKRAAFELVARLAAYAITISHVSAIAYLIHNNNYLVDTNDETFTSSISPNFLKSLIGFKPSASRQPNLDNTDYFFEGRTYGVASSVGTTGDGLKKSVRKYRFEEVGYLPQVECLYNSSTNFRIGKEYPHRTFAVIGFLPDSVGSAQWSEYIGATSDSIVAIGVADSPQSPRRYISIAAGEKYRVLNTTQCTVDFVPTLFQVTVDVKDKSIGVVPMSGVNVQDIDPERILTRSAVRELDSMSNSLQSFHGSVLGDALLSSIAAWNSSFNAQGLVSESFVKIRGGPTCILDKICDIADGFVIELI
ncbi:hypothetical protein K4K61_004541 [Colletotrichum sp. SAR11_59]|nr:hypothetical protein K4K61_004541 [Colletotrichum sp. SAR11_59]